MFINLRIREEPEYIHPTWAIPRKRRVNTYNLLYLETMA
jgi:hypothetical protein